jgi:hypothetical protein
VKSLLVLAAVLHGITGSPERWEAQTGRPAAVQGIFTHLGTGVGWPFDRARAPLVLHVSTARNYGEPEVATPLGIARGEADAWFLALNRRMEEHGERVYVRLMAEMNQANNAYAAFDRSGRPRGRSHSTGAFRQAWRRVALVLRGGPVEAIDAKLRRLGLPAVRTGEDVLPRPDVELQWVPQTRGTPDIPANMPRAYWPGGAYVDWVGTDFYSKFPNFRWLSEFYDAFPGKPFVFGEWALWGRDDPGFVRTLFAWMRARPRVRMALYNEGARTNGPFRLSRYPRARRELARQLARR